MLLISPIISKDNPLEENKLIFGGGFLPTGPSSKQFSLIIWSSEQHFQVSIVPIYRTENVLRLHCGCLTLK